jgi:hypothetical protein
MRCELSSPLIWNSKRKWTFAVTLRHPVLYLIRDHINMLTDLARDWNAGPPSDYHRFVPMIYIFELEMHHYRINLYANDHNIIDKPLLRDENGAVHILLHSGVIIELYFVTFQFYLQYRVPVFST